MEPMLAQITIFAGNFAPRGWMFCEGQLLPIAQYTALFSLLGTTYGGDGRTTFALPDLRGRVALGAGQGAGLSPYQEGNRGGRETNTLTTAQMPSHTHNLRANNASGNSADPTNNVLANTVGLDREYSNLGPNVNMSTSAVTSVGGNQPIENRQPFLAIRYIIAIQGIFPSRS